MAGQHYYVDPSFSIYGPGTLATWAGGHDSSVKVIVGDAGFATIEEALVACDDGDVLCCVGTLEPLAVTKTVDIVGLGQDYTMILGPAGGLEVSGTVLVRFKNLGLAGEAGTDRYLKVKNGAKVALVNCVGPTDVPIAVAEYGGAVVAVGCAGMSPQAGDGGAASAYPAARVPADGTAPLRNPGKYRTPMTLLAAAKYPMEPGDTRNVWIDVASFYGMYDPVRSSEGLVARVEIHGATGMVYTRVGLPASQDMRVRWRSAELEIVGVEVVDQLAGELMIGVADFNPGA